MRTFAKYLLWLIFGVLAAVLVWVFLPLYLQSRVLLSVLILLLVAGGCGYLIRQSHSLIGQMAPGLALALPPEGFTGALILVCGDTAQLFTDKNAGRETHHGWYINTPTPEDFALTVQWIAGTSPALLSQMSMMLCVSPEYHQDEA